MAFSEQDIELNIITAYKSLKILSS